MTVQAQQGVGIAVTVALSRFIPAGGLSSPLIFVYTLQLQVKI